MTIGPSAFYQTPALTHWLPSTSFNADTPDPATNSDEFIIDNVNAVSALGPGGYSIHLFPDDSGFSLDESTNIPNGAGVISEVTVEDSSGTVYFTVTGTFHDSS